MSDLRGTTPKFQSPRSPISALSVLNMNSEQYFPVSYDNWVSIEACGTDLYGDGACDELRARVNCVVGDNRRRNSAVSVVGGGRCSVACNSVAFLLFAFSSSVNPSISPSWSCPVSSRDGGDVGAGAKICLYPGTSSRSGIRLL